MGAVFALKRIVDDPAFDVVLAFFADSLFHFVSDAFEHFVRHLLLVVAGVFCGVGFLLDEGAGLLDCVPEHAAFF